MLELTRIPCQNERMEISNQWLAQKLAELREVAGLTQAELAAEIGKYQAWVQRRENGGTTIRLEEAEEWAAVCDHEISVRFRPITTGGTALPEGLAGEGPLTQREVRILSGIIQAANALSAPERQALFHTLSGVSNAYLEALVLMKGVRRG